MKAKLQKIFQKTYLFVLAFIITGFIIQFIPFKLALYTTNEIDNQKIYNQIIYEDLNNDNIAEKISISDLGEHHSSINIYNDDNMLIYIWNIWGKVNLNSVAFYDVNNNNHKSMFMVTKHHDSLFLNTFSYLKDYKSTTTRTFIDLMPLKFDISDMDCPKIIFHDFNDDGYSDVLIHVYSKYFSDYRKLIVYDVKNKCIIHKKKAPIIFSNLTLTSHNNQTFITGGSSSTDFIYDSISQNAHNKSACFQVLDKYLEPTFPPITSATQKSIIEVLPTVDDQVSFICLERDNTNHTFSSLTRYNSKGDPITAKHYNALFSKLFRTNYIKTSEFYAIEDNKNIVLFDENLSIIKRHKNLFSPNNQIYITNVDNDVDDEIIIWNPNKKELTIFRANFKHPTVVNLFNINNTSLSISIKKQKNQSIISVKGYNYWHLFRYQENIFYHIKLMLYVLIFAFILAIIFVIKKLISIRIIIRERQLAQLKLLTLFNQINPHFTLNSLNSIASSILQGEKEVAYDNLIHFSNLIRTSLLQSEKTSRTILEELKFSQDYLQVMQIRYPNKFDYQIIVDTNVNMETTVPIMILQTFVENAINHGIRPKTGKGSLHVTISNYKNHIELSVKDDGVGRAYAKAHNIRNTGKGTYIIDEYLTLFNSFNKSKIYYRIIDLYKERIDCGTFVIIIIPKKYDFNIR